MKNEFTISDFRETLSNWLEKNKIITFLIIISIILAMAVIFIVDHLQDKRQISSSMLAEDIQDKYKDWIQEEEEDRDDKELNMLIDKALSEHGNRFAAQRAIYTNGLMAIERKEWEKASLSFTELVEKWPKSYLAPVSLANLAAVKEEIGENKEAMEILVNVIENYSDISPDVPEAIFNLGRLSELSDKAKAIGHYEELNSKFPGSRWNSLAKSRIMVLKFR